MPKLTIITATYNAAANLPRLLESLAEQTCRDFELVIQDGASTDNTVALAERWRTRLPQLSLLSEKDTGIYDAWNKALRRARGEWILFLGADDCLHSIHSLSAAADALMALPANVDYLATSLVLTLPNGEEIEAWHPLVKPLAALPSGIPFPHPALFHRARLFETRQFDTSLRIAGDYDFVCHTLNAENARLLPIVTSCMSVGGISGSLATMLRSEMECWHVSRRHFPYAFPLKLYARICRSALYQGISCLAGKHIGHAFADCLRRLQGKPSLWSRLDTTSPPLAKITGHPHVTLVITTHQRVDALRRLFDSLLEQSYPHFTVLLGDQNAAMFLQDLLAQYAINLNIERHSIPQQSLSSARNTLLSFAQGDIIAFTDDDCYYDKDTLSRVVDAFTNTAFAVLIANPNMQHTGVSTFIGRENSFSVFSNAPSWVLFFRKEVIEAIGNFDENLGIGCPTPYQSGEETDYLLRVLAQGYRIRRATGIAVFHDAPAYTAANTAQKTYSYALGRMCLLKKHRFPFWFKLANVLYPFARLPLDALHQGDALRYRWAMLKGRVRGLFL